MDLGDQERAAVARLQDSSHGEEHDYVAGSPHLRHPALRARVDNTIRAAVAAVLSRQRTCSVLEVGAGHGSFTDTVLAAGGTPTVTEMSQASYQHLKRKFAHEADVNIIYDKDGSAAHHTTKKFDVILMISVLHHIPDYIASVADFCDKTMHADGALISFQDPLWYPRQTRRAQALSWGSYFAWRVTQGELKRGLKTRWRRLRGIYDESPSDLVEYHVVRQGVDECALAELLEPKFERVEVERYFSTQSPFFQKIGTKYFPANTFGIVATGLKG